MKLDSERLIGLCLAAGAIAIVGVLAFALVGGGLSGSDATASPSPLAVASPTASPTASATPTPEITPSPSPAVTPSPTPSTPPLPAMLAAIGDSYTQAWSVSPSYKRDHPQFSWAIGTDANDGIFSLRERFTALGAKLTVVDAATSGKKMDDAARQAQLVVAQAAKLPAGSTVFVTFELGTNDLCDDPMTDPGVFDAQLRDALDILRAGLPAGSRILMLSMPDFVHFHDLTQASPDALALLAQPSQSANCAPFLGNNTTYTLAESTQMLARYDALLVAACAEIESTDGPSGKLHCRTDPLHLAEKDFALIDLSRVDYFHPSLQGQARMAEAAWQAGYWAALPLPSH
jgi:lysophospholipase L1-like esterase